jgi:hypothetical protein
MLLTSPRNDIWAALTALAAGTQAWQSTALMAGLLAAWTAMGLLAEWQARRTLVTLARMAPVVLITISRDAACGQAVLMAWGADSDGYRRQSRT